MLIGPAVGEVVSGPPPPPGPVGGAGSGCGSIGTTRMPSWSPVPFQTANPVPVPPTSTSGSMNVSLSARFAAGVNVAPPSSERKYRSRPLSWRVRQTTWIRPIGSWEWNGYSRLLLSIGSGPSTYDAAPNVFVPGSNFLNPIRLSFGTKYL